MKTPESGKDPVIPQISILDDLKSCRETWWSNPAFRGLAGISSVEDLRIDDILEADDRLGRFAPWFVRVFPDTIKTNGLIESPLLEAVNFRPAAERLFNSEIKGSLYFKMDNLLPVSGSIKARGGIYEVLKHAENLAVSSGLLKKEEDYSCFDSEKFRNFFSRFRISVGSTGNLGLSIGIVGRSLGFRVSVHMSSDARDWKKRLLRNTGAEVVEYEGNYSEAVASARAEAEIDPETYFIDDENSRDLFTGYSTAALRLRDQLTNLGIEISVSNPLHVYLPCGVGGGPGGIAAGLNAVYGSHAQCYFAEPVQSPSMLLGLATGMGNRISVYDIGLDGLTEADGLAVGRPSGYVVEIIKNIIRGCYTVSDQNLFRLLWLVHETEGIDLEPSALAGTAGPFRSPFPEKGIHIAWLTGGGMVPRSEIREYLDKGKMSDSGNRDWPL